ncbi:MAG: molybdenum cofactor biosynthesis protein [SAR202 cluster bacterium Casp-Chloro-G4]|nr:MogA/MoaB family molybdenum cofactor biosynthesis protein [Chloroflexota bacterium]PKB61918.1 MAG: molybdenum cofactor biosynthesis protein [SAR202 cluster bacterium Casp-Chloro-G4]
MADDNFRLGILTISDTGSKGQRQDTSGDAISEMMAREGFVEVVREIVPDEQDIISAKLKEWCDGGTLDLVLTTGGTGLGPRDVTPEATREVLDIEVPGIAEAMRIQTLKNTPLAMLSRSMAGVRSGCMIVNLPGSEKAVRETLAVAVEAIPHGLQMLKGWRMH